MGTNRLGKSWGNRNANPHARTIAESRSRTVTRKEWHTARPARLRPERAVQSTSRLCPQNQAVVAGDKDLLRGLTSTAVPSLKNKIQATKRYMLARLGARIAALLFSRVPEVRRLLSPSRLSRPPAGPARFLGVARNTPTHAASTTMPARLRPGCRKPHLSLCLPAH